MNGQPALGKFSLKPNNGEDNIRYKAPTDQEAARERGRVERQGDGSDLLVENPDETAQVRFLLDWFCYVSFYVDNQDHPEGIVLDKIYTTHTQTKRNFDGDCVDIYWFSNNEKINGVLREMNSGQHWGSARSGGQGPRTRHGGNPQLCLRFDDTDSNDWSATADHIIELIQDGRIWKVDFSENTDNFFSESGLYHWDEAQHRKVISFLD